MSASPPSRLAFLADAGRAVAAGRGALQLPWLAALSAGAHDDAARGAPFATLAPAEARTLRAFAAQIVPSDDALPAAERAGVVHFVDRALAMPHFAAMGPHVRAGLADLDRRAGGDFAALPDGDQVALMRAVEHTPFFDAARALVILGMSSDPAVAGRGVGDDEPRRCVA